MPTIPSIVTSRSHCPVRLNLSARPVRPERGTSSKTRRDEGRATTSGDNSLLNPLSWPGPPPAGTDTIDVGRITCPPVSGTTTSAPLPGTDVGVVDVVGADVVDGSDVEFVSGVLSTGGAFDDG